MRLSAIIKSVVAAHVLISFTAHATCLLQPLHSVVAEGATTMLTVDCASDPSFETVNWKHNGASEDGPITVFASSPSTSRQYVYHTKANLAVGSHTFSMTGAIGANLTEIGDVRVTVLPSPTHTLTVNNQSIASGTVTEVTSSSPRINCGATCTATPAHASTVNLSATANSGYTFTGWQGDCVGTSTCTLSMLADRTVTATFGTVGSCGTSAVAAQFPADGTLCTTGSLVNGSKATSASAFSWQCQGSQGAAVACQAPVGYTLQTTVTGGTITPAYPTATLLAAGTPTSFTLAPTTAGYQPIVTGTCAGTLTGASPSWTYQTSALSTSCTVIVSFSNVVSGVCNPAFANQTLTTAPATATEQCSASPGGASGVTTNAGTYTWTCNGTGSGAASPSCQATRGFLVTPSATGGTISPNTAVTVAYNQTRQFTLAPGSSGYVAQVGGNCPSGSISGTTYTTGAITAPCSVNAVFSPQAAGPDAIGNGFWIPPDAPNVLVADHSGVPPHPGVTYIPGCLNGKATTNGSSGCAISASTSGLVYGTSTSVAFSFGTGAILSLRYLTASVLPTTTKVVTLNSGDGGNAGAGLSIWLSTSPSTTYANANAKCKSTSTTTMSPQIYLSTAYCSLAPSQLVYLNIQRSTPCATCRYVVNTMSSGFP